MNLIGKAVEELESKISGSGCESGIVVMQRNSDKPMCQYVRGVNLECQFGGRTAEIVTNDPIQAKTRVSFMFGASLDTPEKRTAACAILNATGSFLCLIRPVHACSTESHAPCLERLRSELGDSRVCLIGRMPFFEKHLKNQLTADPEEADIFLVCGDGLFSSEKDTLIERYVDQKRMIFLGPTTSGIAVLLNFEHWCPFGT
jgi:hypothetical protein